MSVVVIDVFMFYISSWFSLGRFYLSKTSFISSRLSMTKNLLNWIIHKGCDSSLKGFPPFCFPRKHMPFLPLPVEVWSTLQSHWPKSFSLSKTTESIPTSLFPKQNSAQISCSEITSANELCDFSSVNFAVKNVLMTYNSYVTIPQTLDYPMSSRSEICQEDVEKYNALVNDRKQLLKDIEENNLSISALENSLS